MSEGRVLCVLETEIETLDEALVRVGWYAQRHAIEHFSVFHREDGWALQITYRDFTPPPADIT